MERTAREGRTVTGFGVVALWALLSLISAAIYILGGLTEAQFTPQNFPELPPEVLQNITTWTRIIVPVISVLSPFIWWILVSLLMQLSTRLFGGSGGFSKMLAVVGMACMPFVLGALIQIPLTGLQAVAGTPKYGRCSPRGFGLPAGDTHIFLAYRIGSYRSHASPAGELQRIRGCMRPFVCRVWRPCAGSERGHHRSYSCDLRGSIAIG